MANLNFNEIAKELVNSFYQPLGFLQCTVSSGAMWDYAKERAVEHCLSMQNELSRYSTNDTRWGYWSLLESHVKQL